MSEDKYKQIFSENLNHYMFVYNKSQNDIIKDLGINKSSISTWCNGTRLPRMDKVELLARYFNIKRSDLIEDKTQEITDNNTSYSLSKNESHLIEQYRQLNNIGKDKVNNYISDLMENPRNTCAE